MISGRQALGSIDEALDQAHRQVDELQRQIGEASASQVAVDREQAGDYRALARARLGQLSRDALIQQLDHAERQALALLEQRAAAMERLRQQLDQVEAQRRQLEEQRTAQAARLDEAVAQVDQAEAATQARLDAQEDYRAQRERAEQAQRKAAHAEDKAERSAAEREDKGRAYREDPLFRYLWERSYGLPGYQANALVRWLDGKVARLIGYAEARANFDRLDEIPVRLREHATELKTLAESAFGRLRQLDEEARAADGIPALEGDVAKQQEALDDIDRQIAVAEEQIQVLLDQQSHHAAGEDEQMLQAVAFLANEFRRAALTELREDATRTPYPEDDLIVSRMAQREIEQRQLQTDIDGLKAALQQQQARMLELERLRTDFKRERYDRSGSVFTSDAILPMLLGQFLGGLLDRGTLWKVLREHQRYRPRRSDPGFGSGGFGRGTVWNGGLGDLGGIFGGRGRGGGLGGGGPGGGAGGFRTGGGF